MKKALLFIAVLLAVLPVAPAFAAGALADDGRALEASSTATVVTADKLTFDYIRKFAKFEGNVIVNDPRLQISSDTLTILFTEDDLSERVTPLDKSGNRVKIVEDDEADDAVLNCAPGTVVSYTVAPKVPSATSRCYKMLIGADNHVLYYFKRHRITGKTGSGFTPQEFKSISAKAQ